MTDHEHWKFLPHIPLFQILLLLYFFHVLITISKLATQICLYASYKPTAEKNTVSFFIMLLLKMLICSKAIDILGNDLRIVQCVYAWFHPCKHWINVTNEPTRIENHKNTQNRHTGIHCKHLLYCIMRDYKTIREENGSLKYLVPKSSPESWFLKNSTSYIPGFKTWK